MTAWNPLQESVSAGQDRGGECGARATRGAEPATAGVASWRLEGLPEIDRRKITVNPKTGCWESTAAKRKDGYGQVNRGGRNQKAHRYVYEALVRPLTQNVEQLDHLCRVRCCVNPAHLEVVEHVTNARRGAGVISGVAPPELHQDLARLLNRAYRAGVLEGIRQGRSE